MINVFKTWGLVLLFSFSCILKAQETKPKEILFVGNSYTYFWNLPQSVDVLLGKDGSCKQSTAGGANLGQHFRGEKKLHTVKKLSVSGIDVLILQDHSRRAIEHPDSLHFYGEKLAQIARKNNPSLKIYLYMTWAREWDPYMQEEITREYEKLGKDIKAEVVPVGLAWKRARELRPGLALYDGDQSHPSPLGTYLTACVFYRAITGKTPIGLPERIVGEDKNGEKLYLNIQSKENALFCQKVADEVVEKFQNR